MIHSQISFNINSKPSPISVVGETVTLVFRKKDCEFIVVGLWGEFVPVSAHDA